MKSFRERIQSIKTWVEQRFGGETLVFTTRSERRIPRWMQFQYFTHILNKKEFWLFFSTAAVLVVAVPVLLVRLYFQFTVVGPDFGGEYTEGLVGAPQYINPLLSTTSDVDSDLTRLVFSGLFAYDAQQQLQPDLITNYVVSEDQLTYTFFLRPNVQWHDGEPFDADDVLFTIQAIQDPIYQSPLQSSLSGVVAEKIDEYSFSLKLTEPFAPFLSTLTFGIMPEHLWFNVPAQNIRLTELNLRPVGTGPFAFDTLKKDKDGNVKEFVVQRNDDYYGNKPYLDTLNLQFYYDTQTAVDALAAKNVEGLAFIPKASKADIEKKNGDVRFQSLRIPQYTAIFFNQKQSDVLKNETVRKALSYGVDRDSIVRDVLLGEGEAIFTPILPGYIGHNSEVEKYLLNVDEANRLLEEDGWKYPAAPEPAAEETPAEGESGTPASDETVTDAGVATPAAFVPREKDGVKLEFTVSTVELPEYQQALAHLQEQWQAIGVKVNVDLYSPQDIQSKILKKRNYEALLFGEIVGSDPDPYPFWHSSQQEHPGLGLAIFHDREVDQLLEEARQKTSVDERRLLYLHFQNNIASEIPAIFLYNPLYTYGVHAKMKGIPSEQYITSPSDRFSGVTQWYTKTKRQWK